MDEVADLAGQMKNVEHFKKLSPIDLLSIVSSGQVRDFKADSILFNEGDHCTGMYVLLKGKIDLLKTGPEGQISIITSLTPVIMFNEVPVLDGGDNPTTALAIEDVKVWFIPCERFSKLVLRYPELATGLLTVMARRNRIMISNYSDLSFRTVPARVAKHLVDLSEYGSKSIDRSTNTNRDIAAKIVTTPEAISRTLKTFGLQKYIEINRLSIKVLDPDSLCQLAQID